MRATTSLCLSSIGIALFVADLRIRTEARRHQGLPKVAFARITGFDAGFDEPLAWDEADPPTGRVPRRVQALDGKSFALEGYMQPLEYDENDSSRVRQFLLTELPVGCCAGHVPRMQDYVLVTMDGEGADVIPLTSCLVEGRFALEPWIDDEGDVLVLFQMRSSRVRRGR
ncbi:MAG: hypothetical protein H6832_05910 [Planctomycetes bacterium]|nr:hypothetical protein [Planctomycetota bacterium]MCB9917920.1 hypothetical protein [Planctomycetota bacterium]